MTMASRKGNVMFAKVQNELIQLSQSIHSVFNSVGPCDKGYYAFGHVYASKEDVDRSSGGKIDARNDIDNEILEMTVNQMLANIIEFYAQAESDDEFLLYLGAVMNMYYIIGFHQTMGRFPFDKIRSIISDKQVLDYAKWMEAYIYTRFYEMFFDVKNDSARCFTIVDRNLYESIWKNAKTMDEKQVKESLYKAIDKKDQNYAPDIYRFMVERKSNRLQEAKKLLEYMVQKPYSFGKCYQCMEAAKAFYEFGGKCVDVLKQKQNLGADLYRYVIGEVADPFIYTYAIGIPKITIVSQETVDNELADILRKEMESTYEVSTEEIRYNTQYALGVGVRPVLSKSPFGYIDTIDDIDKYVTDYCLTDELSDNPFLERENESFHVKLDRLRQNCKKKNSEIYTAIAVSKQTYSNWFNKDNPKVPTRDKLLSLCIAMQVSADDTIDLFKAAERAFPLHRYEYVVFSCMKAGIYDIEKIQSILDKKGIDDYTVICKVKSSK